VLPGTESLKTTLARVQPYWEDRIAPELLRGRNVLVAAHGNSLRALVKMLEGISDDEITELNIPTGVPRLYELDARARADTRQYLGDAAAMIAPAARARGRPGARRRSSERVVRPGGSRADRGRDEVLRRAEAPP
jgi:2,3-bisphosphoglycerate-dependent phosphoglycerate mutase